MSKRARKRRRRRSTQKLTGGQRTRKLEVGLIISLISIVVTVLLALPTYLSRVTITLRGASIQHGSPPADLTVHNDGICFDIYSADVRLYLAKHESSGANVIQLNDFYIGTERVADNIEPDQSVDFWVPRFNVTAAVKADVTIVLRYRPEYTWCCSYICQRFTSGVDTSNEPIWYRAPPAEPCKYLWQRLDARDLHHLKPT